MYHAIVVELFFSWQVALVSTRYETNCSSDKIPLKYVRVDSFYNWILNNTKDATYCYAPHFNENEDEQEKLNCTIEELTFLPLLSTSETVYYTTEKETFLEASSTSLKKVPYINFVKNNIFLIFYWCYENFFM